MSARPLLIELFTEELPPTPGAPTFIARSITLQIFSA